MKDPDGDLVDADDRPVRGPDHVDIVALSVAEEGPSLLLRLALGGAVPNVSADRTMLNHLFVIDTDGDGSADWWVSAENRSSGAFTVVLTTWATGMSSTTGRVSLSGSALTVELPLAALGSPADIRACAMTQAIEASGHVIAEDVVPDQPDCGIVATDWLSLR